MIAADTNIVLRLFIQDDSQQSRKAVGLFSENTVWISRTVILECEWVLRSALKHSRVSIYEMIDTLIHLEGVAVESYQLIYTSLMSYAQGMDFADALHMYSANNEEIAFYTFDKKLAKLASRLDASVQLL